MTRTEAAPTVPLIIAHRGARVEAPENTAAAFHRALTYPIDGIELDVQMSADGVLVLYHDKTLKKLGARRRRVADMEFKELRRLDAGAWFDPAFAGEPPLEFERMLELLAGRTRLFMEIKIFETDQRSGRAEMLADAMLQALCSAKYEPHLESFQILSFDPDTLRYAWTKAPHLKYVLDVSKADAKRLEKVPPGDLQHLHALCIHRGGISGRLVDRLHGQGKKVFTYTCNESATLKKLRYARIDGILTDDPAWLTRKLKRERKSVPSAPGPPRW